MPRVYGFAVASGDEALTVAEFLRRELAGDIEAGDRIAYGLVDLIVRRVSEDHTIEEVGLALEHEHRARPRMPLFQSWREIRRSSSRGRPSEGVTVPAAARSRADCRAFQRVIRR